MSASTDVALAVTSGLTGAVAALVGQYAAQREARRRHHEELRLRTEEFLASFTMPTVSRRAEALAELFDLLQAAIDDGRFEIDAYHRVRRLLIYVPSELGSMLVEGIAELLRAQRSGERQRLDAAIGQLADVQRGLRSAAGLETIDAYTSHQALLRAEHD